MAVEAAPEVSATETAVVEKPADQDEFTATVIITGTLTN